MDPADTYQSLPPGTRLEEFVIERVLGSGGFGITYLARDARLDRHVVIKENLPVQFCYRDPRSFTVAPRHSASDDGDNFRWSLDNFAREAAMLAGLDHPGIVKVLRSFEAFGTAYFVMPFVEGDALDDLARKVETKGDKFGREEVLGLLEHVLDALGYLHGRGIYHRDIKPGNILVTSEGRPVLIDFGAARQRLGEKSLTVVESPGYTPFEQLQSRGNVGPWSDLYALGSTVFKLLTGEAPPKAMDRMPDDSYFPLAARNELVTHYGRELLSSIDRALAVRLAERWQSAGEWRVALQGRERPILPSAQTVQVRNEPPLKTPADKIEPVKSPLAEEAVVQVVTTPGVQRNPKDVVYPWDKAHVGFACPHCRVPLRVQMQFLRAPVFNCGSCGRQIVPKRLSQVSSTEPDVQYNWDLFHWLCSYDARIGRRDFWLLVILPCALLPIFYYVENEILAVAGWFVFITWLFLCFVQATIRRLHDLDHRGNWLWLCLLAFIPPSSAMVIFLGLFIVLLGLVPGKNRPNRFGPPISQMRGPLDRWLFRRAEH